MQTLSPVTCSNLISSYANCGIVAAVSCTKVHNVTGNKYTFVQIVQETAADEHAGFYLGTRFWGGRW